MNTAKFLFAIYNWETIIKKLILKTNKSRTTGATHSTVFRALFVNQRLNSGGFATIILNVCDNISNQQEWPAIEKEGGRRPGVLPPPIIRNCLSLVIIIITWNNRKIYRSGSSKLMSDDRRGWTHRNADLSLWNLLLMFATFFPTSLLTKTRESQSIWCFVHRKWNLWIFNQKPWGGWGGCDHDNEEVTEEGRRVGWSIIYSFKST